MEEGRFREPLPDQERGKPKPVHGRDGLGGEWMAQFAPGGGCSRVVHTTKS